MAVDVEEKVGPFGATVAGVTALVPEARLHEGDGPVPEGTYKVTTRQVLEWVQELTADVAMALDGWERLSTEDTYGTDVVGAQSTYEPAATYGSGTFGAGSLGDKGRLIEAARTIVHNGAASYLEAARHPERSRANADSYSAILWDRYTTRLETVRGWLAGRLAAAEQGDTPDPDGPGLAYSFPGTSFPDGFPV